MRSGASNSEGSKGMCCPDSTVISLTISEAAQLVIQAGDMGEGGDVMVLDMGEPPKIVDLANRIIHLSGFSHKDEANPVGDIEIRFAGLPRVKSCTRSC